MTWFRVDDDLAFHRKVVAAGNAAMGLWVRSGAWCAQHLTDGFIPDDMVSILGSGSQRAKLIKAGLWIEVDGGCLFHGWSENGRQPLAKKVKERRAAAADRQAAYRDAIQRKAQINATRDDVTDASAGAHVTGVVRDPRPDPTRSSSNEEHEERESRKRSATRIPDTWRPNDNHRRYGADHRLEVATQADLFRNHAQSHDRRLSDWDAGFRNWLIKALEIRDRRPNLRAVSGGHVPYQNPTDPSVWDEPLISPKANGAKR